MQGIPLSDYLLREISAIAGRPTIEELCERLASRSQVSPGVSPAEAVRNERNRR